MSKNNSQLAPAPSANELLGAWQKKRATIKEQLDPLERRQRDLEAKQRELRLFAVSDPAAGKELDSIRAELAEITVQASEFRRAFAECDASIGELEGRSLVQELADLEALIAQTAKEQNAVIAKRQEAERAFKALAAEEQRLGLVISDAYTRRQPLRERITAHGAVRVRETV